MNEEFVCVVRFNREGPHDPDATLLQVRFVSRSGSDKFDFGTLTFCPQSRRSSCLCRFVGASLGDGETESNRTELSWAV